jgi:hypothetical protein
MKALLRQTDTVMRCRYAGTSPRPTSSAISKKGEGGKKERRAKEIKRRRERRRARTTRKIGLSFLKSPTAHPYLQGRPSTY